MHPLLHCLGELSIKISEQLQCKDIQYAMLIKTCLLQMQIGDEELALCHGAHTWSHVHISKCMYRLFFPICEYSWIILYCISPSIYYMAT